MQKGDVLKEMRLGKEDCWGANFSTLHYFVCFIFIYV